jgi:hypothetical protein
MTKHTEEFANCTIKIEDNDNLTIQSKLIDYEHDADTATWSSRYLPYTHYKSLIELARAIAGETLEFVGKQN